MSEPTTNLTPSGEGLTIPSTVPQVIKQPLEGTSHATPGSAHEFPCTECGGDAFIGMSNLRGPDGQIIGTKERLCMKCCKRRGGFNPFEK